MYDNLLWAKLVYNKYKTKGNCSLLSGFRSTCLNALTLLIIMTGVRFNQTRCNRTCFNQNCPMNGIFTCKETDMGSDPDREGFFLNWSVVIFVL